MAKCRVPGLRWVSEIWILCSEPSVANRDPPRGVTCSRHVYEGRARRKCDVVHTALKFSRSGDCDLDGPSPGVRTADTLLSPSASRAEGTVAVIDVFRAFTTAAVALANGGSRIVMVGGVEGAFALRDADLGQVCMGEVGGRAPDGFDFGKFADRDSVRGFQLQNHHPAHQRRHTGIVAAATEAKRLYAASLVTADATVCAMLSGAPERITLVAMGDSGRSRSDEDEICTIHLRNRLQATLGLDHTPRIPNLRESHRANLAVHRASHGFSP